MESNMAYVRGTINDTMISSYAFGDGSSNPLNPDADMMTVVENAAFEGYDWPGEYAQRFDGIDKVGDDTFEFKPELTTEPTAPEACGDGLSLCLNYEQIKTEYSEYNGDGGSIDGLTVDLSNPNTDVYAGDFLIERWQKSCGTVESGGDWLV
jgi:hypothetical protein